MMHVVGIFLVVSSLAAAGIWSPSPENNQNEGLDVIVKEGDRVVVFEYGKESHHNPKVSVSEKDHGRHRFQHEGDDVAENVKENINSARELVCDKCRDRIASAVGKVREKAQVVEEGAREAVGKAHVVEEGAKESMGKVKEKVQETVGETIGKVHAVEEGVKEAMGKVKEKAQEAGEGVKETVGEAIGKARDVEEGVEEAMEKAKHTAKETVGKAKERAQETVGEAVIKEREEVENAKKTAKTMAKDVVVNVSKAAKEASEEAKKIKTAARRVEEAAYNKLNQIVSGTSLGYMAGVTNLLGFATAYGMCVWVTFVSSHVLAGGLPRQQFGVVQSKIYPVYFRAMAWSIGAASLGNLLGRRKHLFSSKTDLFQGYNLGASLLMVLVNLMFLEPRATKVMYEKVKMEKEEGRGMDGFPAAKAASPAAKAASPATWTPEKQTEQEAARSPSVALRERLKKLNSYSSFLNILTLMSLSWHLVYLSQLLQNGTC